MSDDSPRQALSLILVVPWEVHFQSHGYLSAKANFRSFLTADSKWRVWPNRWPLAGSLKSGNPSQPTRIKRGVRSFAFCLLYRMTGRLIYSTLPYESNNTVPTSCRENFYSNKIRLDQIPAQKCNFSPRLNPRGFPPFGA